MYAGRGMSRLACVHVLLVNTNLRLVWGHGYTVSVED
jgi:hypothetical protein